MNATMIGQRIERALFGRSEEFCIGMAFGIPIVGIASAASLLSRQVALVLLGGLVVWAVSVRMKLLQTARNSVNGSQRSFVTLISVAGVVGAVASVPITCVVLNSDLQAISSDARAGIEQFAVEVVNSNSTTAHPSFEPCLELSNLMGDRLANPCFAGVSYLRVWQDSDAAALLVAGTVGCAIYPGVVASQLRRKKKLR